MSLKLLPALLSAAVLLIAPPALADREACANSYEKAQRARQAHQLKAARSDLLVCSKSECQAWIKKDCLAWLGQVEAAMPSVIVDAHDANGKPKTDVRVTIDGAFHSVTESISLDPGEHKLVVDAPGVAKIEQTFVLKEGEHDRKIDLTLAPASAEPKPVTPPPSEVVKEPGTQSREKPVPILTWALGGTGIVLGGVGTVFQISGMSKTGDLDTCSPRCVRDDVDSAKTTLLVGNIMLGAAVVAIVGAVVVYLTR